MRRPAVINEIKSKCRQFFATSARQKSALGARLGMGFYIHMRRIASAACLSLALSAVPAAAEYRITRDHGGLVEQYKAKYVMLRDRGDRIIIDGICNSACTLVLGIVPLSRICVTPNASFGFHQAYYDKRWTFGVRVTSSSGTDELMAAYPPAIREWLRKRGGLTPDMKKLKNGYDLWMIVNPCPEWPGETHVDATVTGSTASR
jgi:hypothetical protein